ncbi:MAG: zinc resistance protein [Desulfobulbus sp.]|nr:MAG: zinc resistance protein [Desulfobulbus sp.]
MNKGMKTVIGVAIIGLVLSAVSAFAVGYGPGGGGCGMRGWGGGYSANVNDADYKKFLDDTAALRKTIAVDRAELDALMAGKEPDAKRVRELTATIVDNQEKVAEIAREANISGPGTGGQLCNGPRGFGGGCRGGNGPGYGQGCGPGNGPCR